MSDNTTYRRNTLPSIGFLLSLLAFLSYPLFFARFPLTRNFPWANLLLFGLAIVFLVIGLLRPFRAPQTYKGKILAPVLSALGALVLVGFLFVVFIFARQLPASLGAPRVGSKAPEFTLTDTNNNPVSLTSLLTSASGGAPTRGVLLIFYRGYW